MMFALSAVPLVLAIGGAVDFRNASNSERDVQSDLDSAVLAASHSISTASEGELEAEVKRFFSAQQIARSGTFEINQVTVDKANRTIEATATGTVPTMFLQVMGMRSIDMTVRSGSHGVSKPYLDILIVVDNSASMLLAATPADQEKMQREVSCVFACHTPEGQVGSTAYPTFYAYARGEGIRLRSDVVADAIRMSLEEIRNADPNGDRIRVGLYTIGDNAKEIVRPDYLSAEVGTPVTLLGHVHEQHPWLGGGTPAPAGSQEALINARAARLSDTSDDTSLFDLSLDTLTRMLGRAGSGDTPAEPKKLLMLLTDGMISTREWVWESPNKIAPMNPKWCDQMKNRGIDIAALYTEYLPIPWDWGYNAGPGASMGLAGWASTWGGYMRADASPSMTRRDYVPLALEDCASSPKYFLSANSESEIHNGMAALLNAYLSSPRLTH
ncbi:MAG: hypothetical protein KAG89_07390 [Fulvimarina manganoxydans]|uniref:pilus assembly protein TadG-related protein n=1 Tax=Fulvimarina manganoxydans TaxID=937218 RepID=UPI00235770FC|nr:pilus assembly protein TadG-related protein [Fulvimarina manganoxydans]MCK5931982.1 hypothetical protein [Fulvimarina manganoxydans]